MVSEDFQQNQGWIEAFRNGESQALAHCFKLHTQSLGYFAVRLIQNEPEAEDIVADCFVKVWKRREDFHTEEQLKAFLYVTCRNACLDYLRHLKVRTAAQDAYFRDLEQSEDSILYQIIKSEVLQALHEEIELLPENYRQVFKLIYFKDKKTDEIAADLGLSVQTVRNYKARAVELLKTAMLKKGMAAVVILALRLVLDGR